MTFLEKLQSRKGGLIRLKTQLCWYDGQGWDNNPGRICILLDATAVLHASIAAYTSGATTEVALLLIDGSPQWVWVDEQDIDLLVNDPPAA